MNALCVGQNLVGNQIEQGTKIQVVKRNISTNLNSLKFQNLIPLYQKSNAKKKSVQKSKAIIKKEVDQMSVLLPFTCTMCHEHLPDRENVSKHMHKVHKRTSIYTCLECCFTFCSRKMLNNHKAGSNCK